MKLAVALTLALASGAAAALGLGQIEVKSRLDQPLLAEIPVISNDPAELEQLQARLASPETFARIGLEAPQGLVSGLQFAVALDNAGNPVIRVTSAQPVTEPLLTFLVEVDWGQGRLVREYSALVDAPRTVSAPAQPPIQAPIQAPSNIIERPVEPTVAQQPVEEAPAPEPASDAELPGPEAVAPAPVDAIPVAPSPAAPDAVSPQVASGEYEVRRGDTLSQIADQVEGRGQYSLNQTMIALLRANPEAFIDGNINLLKQGAVLQVPEASSIADVELNEALALVRAQVSQWREATRPVPQPASNLASDSATGQPAEGAVATAATPGAAGARLEIVPPGASAASQAGTQSGISAGGEGDMLRQELQQNQETLAARDAELAEMKGRIAELETLQAQQQQLLSMKDSELAAAQQRLAQTGDAAAPGESGSALPWILGGAVLVLVLLAGWFMRRRARPAPVFRAPATPAGASALAEGFPQRDMPAADGPGAVSAQPVPSTPVESTPVESAPVQSAPAPDPATAPMPGATAPGAARSGPVKSRSVRSRAADRGSSDPAPVPVPHWPSAAVSAGRPDDAPSSAPAPLPFWNAPAEPVSSSAPTWHQGGDPEVRSPALTDPLPATLASQGSNPPAAEADLSPEQERLELARAYIDLGDRDSARQLLGEVAVNGDHAARQEATRMLREID